MRIVFILVLLSCAACSKVVDRTPPIKDTVALSYDTVPLKNGYGIPDETGINIGSNGTSNWTTDADSARVYVTFNATGDLKVALLAKSPDGPGSVTIHIAGQSLTVHVPQSTTYQRLDAGTVHIASTGITKIQISGTTKPGGYYADCNAILMGGAAAVNAYYNKSAWRTCPAVHIGYNIPSGDTASWFYNEINVAPGSDVIPTFFMANGFYPGYFGIQVNGPGDRRILFSIWSDYNTNDPGQVPSRYAVRLVQKGGLVTTEEAFGNEGTGRHSIAEYDWSTGTTYKFLVHSVPDTGGVTYTGYIFLNGTWNLIASYYKPVGIYNMAGLYSFIEDFGNGLNSYKGRTMTTQNQWIVTPSGRWVQLTSGYFTSTTHDDVFSRVDYGAAVNGAGYTFFTGGFVPQTATDNEAFTCLPGQKPAVTLPN